MAEQEYIEALRRKVVVGEDGVKIGRVEQVYLDDATENPTFVTVKTGSFLAKREPFVPLDQARIDDAEIHVPYPKDFIHDAPSVDHDQPLGRSDEDRIYGYYGLRPADEEESSGEGSSEIAAPTATPVADHVETGEAEGQDSGDATDTDSRGTAASDSASGSDVGMRSATDDPVLASRPRRSRVADRPADAEPTGFEETLAVEHHHRSDDEVDFGDAADEG